MSRSGEAGASRAEGPEVREGGPGGGWGEGLRRVSVKEEMARFAVQGAVKTPSLSLSTKPSVNSGLENDASSRRLRRH